ncbi:MAG: hypothetical protein IPI91_12340 [Flavobacteriales bacterium]|nr:hypothetical protein [Flavobacteriales bacterium]
MILKPNTGIGDLKFGMSKSDIQKLIGKPDRDYLDDEDPTQNLCEYNAHKLRLTFYTDHDTKLGYMRCRDPKLMYGNTVIIGQNIDKVLEQFVETGSDFEDEEHGFFRAYFDETTWLTIVEEYDEVSEIELGVPYKNDDEYLWPA